MIQISEIPGVATQASPASALVLNEIYVAFQGGTTNDIWWTWFDGKTWNPELKFSPNPGADGGPTLAVLGRDSLYMAWKGGSGDSAPMYISSCSDVTWSKPAQVNPSNGKALTSAPPAMAEFSGKLWLAWKDQGKSTDIYIASFDGKSWSDQTKITTPSGVPQSHTGPALAAANGKLVLGWAGDSDLHAYYAEFDGKTWSGQKEIAPKSGTALVTDTTPAFVTSGGRLCCAARGKNDSFIAWQTYDGSNWDAPRVLPLSLAAGSPSLVSFNNDVYLFWKEANRSGIFYTSFSGTSPEAAPFPLPADFSYSSGTVGFGSGANNANFNVSLEVKQDGSVQFSGQYNDTGSIPIFTSPTQNYNLALGVISSDGKVFTFSHSGSVPSAQSDKWNISAKSAAIAQDWPQLSASHGIHLVCSNSSDLGSVLDSLLSDLKTLFGWIETAVEVVSVVAAVAA